MRWLGINLLLYVPVLAVALLAYALATDEEFTTHLVFVNVFGFFLITLPALAIYLALIWVLRARMAAVLLAPAIFLILYAFAETDDTSALTIALTLGLPALAYGVAVRLPSGRGPVRRLRRGTRPGTRPAA
jgi:hypothetical protein